MHVERFKFNSKQKSIVQPAVGQNRYDATFDGEIFEKSRALGRHMVYNSSMSNEHLNRILLDIYRSAKDIFGEKLDEVILYGSFARGDYEDGSDIDIMILANIERESAKEYRAAVSEMAWEIGMKHDILVSVSVNGSTYFHDWKNDLPFYRNVWNEGRRLSA